MPAPLLLDACVAINLIATQEFDEIAVANSVTFLMVAEAAAEVSSLRSAVDGERVIVPISVEEYTRSGSLVFTQLEDSEFPLFVQFAAQVDDGEAATMAVAATRSLPLASDDKGCRRLCAERELPEPLYTSRLVRRYVTDAGRTPKEISRLLRKVEEQASFVPPRNDPDRSWWMNYLRLEES